MNKTYRKRPFLGVCVFRRNFTYSEEFGAQKIGGGHYRFRLNGSKRFNIIFGVGIFEKIMSSKNGRKLHLGNGISASVSI